MGRKRSRKKIERTYEDLYFPLYDENGVDMKDGVHVRKGCERDCLYLSRYPNSNEKEKRRTELICAIEESQKNKHFNFSKGVLQEGGEFYRKKKSQVSHWKQKWNVSTYQANDPRWGSCVENNKNLSIMNRTDQPSFPDLC